MWMFGGVMREGGIGGNGSADEGGRGSQEMDETKLLG